MKIVWSRKSIRMVLGILMMVSFVDLALTLDFLVSVCVRLGSLYLAGLVFVAFGYLYAPCVMLIVVCYVLLTRVFKYEEKI